VTGETTRLDRAIEIALTAGLLVSAALMSAGLLLERPPLVRLGILLLLFTPLVRVVVVTIGFSLRREWIFVGLSLWILAVLGSSLHVAGFL
jgi:uncharacterized membrane protein